MTQDASFAYKKLIVSRLDFLVGISTERMRQDVTAVEDSYLRGGKKKEWMVLSGNQNTKS